MSYFFIERLIPYSPQIWPNFPNERYSNTAFQEIKINKRKKLHTTHVVEFPEEFLDLPSNVTGAHLVHLGIYGQTAQAEQQNADQVPTSVLLQRHSIRYHYPEKLKK